MDLFTILLLSGVALIILAVIYTAYDDRRRAQKEREERLQARQFAKTRGASLGKRVSDEDQATVQVIESTDDSEMIGLGLAMALANSETDDVGAMNPNSIANDPWEGGGGGFSGGGASGSWDDSSSSSSSDDSSSSSSSDSSYDSSSSFDSGSSDSGSSSFGD